MAEGDATSADGQPNSAPIEPDGQRPATPPLASAPPNPGASPQFPFPQLQQPFTPPQIGTQNIPQLAGMMIQQGFAIGQPQQNPQVIQHITQFLATDSANRLSAYESTGKRNHQFRMSALIIVGIIVGMILLIPLVALARGDMNFVITFLDKYFQTMIIIALALLGGGKLFELVKG